MLKSIRRTPDEVACGGTGNGTKTALFGQQRVAFVLSGGGSLGAMQVGQLLALFEAASFLAERPQVMAMHTKSAA